MEVVAFCYINYNWGGGGIKSYDGRRRQGREEIGIMSHVRFP